MGTFVLVNEEGLFAHIFTPSTHGNFKYALSVVDDLNKATVFTSVFYHDVLKQTPSDVGRKLKTWFPLPATETRQVRIVKGD